jgi:hypothetical protein
MESLIGLLQEEVSQMRELLANLTLEEKMILSPKKQDTQDLLEERSKIENELQDLKRKKEGVLDDDPVEIASLQEQVISLEAKIKEKKESNESLKKMKKYQIASSPKKEKERPVKKPLLLEE